MSKIYDLLALNAFPILLVLIVILWAIIMQKRYEKNKSKLRRLKI